MVVDDGLAAFGPRNVANASWKSPLEMLFR